MSQLPPPSRDVPAKADAGIFEMTGVGKHAAIYAVGVFLERGVGVLMLPVYTRYLTPEDYGVMGLIIMTLEVITILAGARLVQGLFRFYHKEEVTKGRERIVSTAALALILSYSILAVVCFSAADRLSVLVFESERHGPLIRLASAAMLAESVNIVPLAYAQVRDLSKLFVTASAVRLLLAVGLNVLFLVGLGWGVEAMFVSTLITQGLVGAYLNLWLLRDVGMAFDLKVLNTLVRYSAPLVATQFASFIYMFGDRYVLQRFAGEASVGTYDIAFRIASVLPLIAHQPLARVWAPKRFEIAKREDRHSILARGHFYQSIALCVGLVGLSVFADEIITLMTAPAFRGAAVLVPILSLSWIFQCWALNQDIGILITERTGAMLISEWIAAGVAVGLYLAWIPDYGGVGAAWATVVALGARWVLVYSISQRLWRVEYDWPRVAKVFVLAAPVLLVAQLISFESLWVSVTVKSILVVAYVGALWRSDVLTPSEHEWLATASPSAVWRMILARGR